MHNDNRHNYDNNRYNNDDPCYNYDDPRSNYDDPFFVMMIPTIRIVIDHRVVWWCRTKRLNQRYEISTL